MNFANTRFYTGMGIRQAGNIWGKRVDEVSYHKIDELIMEPTVEINHNVLEKHQDKKLAPDPENGSGRGGKCLEYESKEPLLATVGHP